MSTPYTLLGELPVLERPVLVVCLSGWIDASGAAAAAMATLEERCEARPIVSFDSDAFIDYRARRPTMELREGVNTRLVWNELEMKVGEDERGNAVLTLTGPEPDSQWKAFAAAVKVLALQLGVHQMIGLGAYPFATPHTRASRLSCTTPSAEVAANVPFIKNSVDVPAGMGAVLEHALTEAGIPSLGIWVQVPHYVSAMSYPAASVALLEGLREVTGRLHGRDGDADFYSWRDLANTGRLRRRGHVHRRARPRRRRPERQQGVERGSPALRRAGVVAAR